MELLTSETIENSYRHYSNLYYGEPHDFPYGTRPTGIGKPHYEIKKDGKILFISTDRAVETKRRETYDIEEFMYWIFSDFAMGHGWAYAYKKSNLSGDLRRVVFPKALDSIERISPEWRDKLEKQLIKILENHPYNDSGHDT